MILLTRTEDRPRTFWQTIAEAEPAGTGAGWWAIVRAAGDAAVHLVAPPPERETVLDLLARVERLDAALGADLEQALVRYSPGADEAATLVGVALARTWPAGPEDLDAWPARA